MQDSNECAGILEAAFHNFDDYFAVYVLGMLRHESLAAVTGIPNLLKRSRSRWHKKGSINFNRKSWEGRNTFLLAFMKHSIFSSTSLTKSHYLELLELGNLCKEIYQVTKWQRLGCLLVKKWFIFHSLDISSFDQIITTFVSSKMTLQWAFAAGFLYFEIGLLFLFCVPFISPRRQAFYRCVAALQQFIYLFWSISFL